MTIIFAPTKLFNPNAKKANYNPLFPNQTTSLVENIKKIPKDQLQKEYKLSNHLIDDVYQYYKNFNNNDSYLSFNYYLGESFKSFNYETLNHESLDYLNENVYIIDALYGLIRPYDGIKPYRMDFTLKGYKSLWKPIINNYLKTHLKSNVILSLASKEFSGLINTDEFTLYEVSFIDCKENECKKISVFNKQMRGLLLRYIVDQNIRDINLLPEIINDYVKIVDGFEINYIKKN
ncbi:YaaA family protein [Acholeplasma granularum]|uniref:YaaA family protein n=1 Tax=Acholeplasma granularum TaxID=264635 RepID=UPI000472898A|nr:YaaA family protein [Acholeplasma granularum]